MVRRLLFALLVLGPLVIVLDSYTEVGDIMLFVVAALALIPLAWLIGEATEHAGHHTGPGIGGFLNATFGNAPELIFALIAVNEGLTEVVRGSLTGSVIGNLLLVLGFSLLFGGRGRLDRESSLTSFALVAFAVVLFLIPSIPGWEGDPDRHSLAVVSVPVSIVLLLVYVVVTWYSLRRHRSLHVSNEAEVQAMFDTAVRDLGTVDILVSNAGLQRDAPFHEMTVAQWDTVMNVNLRGAFLCAREAVREFLRRGVRPEISVAAGKIIFISSVHDIIPWAGHVNYAASKGGLTLLMKSLAQEVAERRIRVNSISPGAIRTPINTAAWNTPQAYAELMKLIPYKRIGEPAEIGQAAVWLASDFTDYIVGSTIYIDGGMTLYPGFETGG